MIQQITVPDLGEASEVEVIELLVAVGDQVVENDSLLVLESDKAAMEIPAPMAGVVKSIDIALGAKVNTGSPIMQLEVAGDAASQEASQEASPVPSVPPAATPAPAEAVSEQAAAAAAAMVQQPPAAATESAPTTESSNSATESSTPATKSSTPATKSSTPATKSSTPATESSTPATESSTPATESSATAAATGSAPATASTDPDAPVESQGKVYAGPAVRKLARELGVDLTSITGTGTRGRVVKRDVHEFVKARINAPVATGMQPAALPDIDFSRFGEVEQVERSKLHKTTAVNMQRNWSSVPHVAQFNEADVTELEAFRTGLQAEAEQQGVKLTLLPFLLKACAAALQQYPQFNVSVHSSGEYVIQKKYYHIGVAVATAAGLMVPVIRDVDKKSVWQLAAEVMESSHKARQRQLSLDEMQGACFTISSLGAIGGTGFIPIINAPEVAILGVAKTAVKPVFLQGEFRPRSLLPLTLSYDHRAVNGVDGGQFADYLVKLLADIRRLLL